MHNIISITSENIDKEHICCALSGDEAENKKQWMKAQFQNGLTFKKLNERGKVFIEYIPAEYAFAPIIAPNYMYINCFWVSGKFKGQGYANNLLEACISDAKAQQKEGLVILSSAKKKPFLSDSSFLKHKNFILADTAIPYFELYYLPFHKQALKPQFAAHAKTGKIKAQGMVLYYSHQCPFTEKYTQLIENIAIKKQITFQKIKIRDYKEAQNSPCVFTSYSLFINGQFETNEILSENKFLKLL